MPSEIRHIVFTAAEVLEALIEHRRRVGGHLPRGTVETASCETAEAGGSVQFRMEVLSDRAAAGAGPESVIVQAPEILAALLGYCRSRSIPVAMRAEKSLERFGARLGLVLTMTAKGKEKVTVPGAAQT